MENTHTKPAPITALIICDFLQPSNTGFVNSRQYPLIVSSTEQANRALLVFDFNFLPDFCGRVSARWAGHQFEVVG